MTARYAIYFCPGKSSDLAKFGQAVLQRDGGSLSVPKYSNAFFDQDLAWQLIKSPRHYSFHATVKAPFSLSVGVTEADLVGSLQSFCQNYRAIEFKGLKPGLFHGFLALHLENTIEAVDKLAADCVENFEAYRAPLTPADIEKRKPERLSAKQQSYLSRYGYPYVMDEYRFHMTVTGQLIEPVHTKFVEWAIEQYTRLVTQTPRLDRLTLCKQENRAVPFFTLAECPFD